jgi:hypothetical protein
MSRFVQGLESRTLFSAASAAGAVLAVDAKQVVATAATARTDLRFAVSAATIDTNVVAADLKTSTTSTNRPANAGLLRTLRSDEVKTFATLRSDETALLVVGASLSARAAADAKSLLLHPTNAAIQARVAADMTALATVPAARLATLQADALNGVLGADLTNLVNANPANTSLANDTNAFTAGGAAAAAIGNVVTAAGTFTTATGALNAEVNSSTSGSVIPNLVGTYSGSFVSSNGSDVGKENPSTFDISTEGADGSLSGTATVTHDGNPTTFSLSGSVAADGSFTATLTDPTGQQTSQTLTGTASRTTISGTGSDGGGGTFTFTLSLE